MDLKVEPNYNTEVIDWLFDAGQSFKNDSKSSLFSSSLSFLSFKGRFLKNFQSFLDLLFPPF